MPGTKNRYPPTIAYHAKTAGDLFAGYDSIAPSLFGLIRYNIASQKEAEQILEKVFVKASAQIEDYKPENARLFTWLFQLTKQEIIGSCGSFNMRRFVR